MTTPRDPIYAGYRFPPEIISYAVWLYFRFPLSGSVKNLGCSCGFSLWDDLAGEPVVKHCGPDCCDPARATRRPSHPSADPGAGHILVDLGRNDGLLQRGHDGFALHQRQPDILIGRSNCAAG